jgi:hypothetical protein
MNCKKRKIVHIIRLIGSRSVLKLSELWTSNIASLLVETWESSSSFSSSDTIGIML